MVQRRSLVAAVFGAVLGLIEGTIALALAIARGLAEFVSLYNPFGRVILALAAFAGVVDAAIAYRYGAAMTALHGTGFAIVAIAFMVIPDWAIEECRRGKWAAGLGFGLVALCLGVVALQSHVGYSSGVRASDMQLASFTGEQHSDGRDEVAKAKAFAEIVQKRIEGLQADLDASKGFSTTVTADGLAAEVAAMEGDRVYRRSKACADVTLPESRTFCDRLAGLKRRIASAAEMKDAREELQRANAALARIQAKAAEKPPHASVVVHQNGVFQRVAEVVGYKVGADLVSIATATTTSLGFMLLAPALWALAGRNRRELRETHAKPPSTGLGVPSMPAGTSAARSALAVRPASAALPATVVREVHHHHAGKGTDIAWRELANRLRTA